MLIYSQDTRLLLIKFKELSFFLFITIFIRSFFFYSYTHTNVHVIDVNRQQQLTSIRSNETNARLLSNIAHKEIRNGEKINCKWKTASADGNLMAELQ